MEQIVIQVKDGSKTEWLIELLRSLDFVQSVTFAAEEEEPTLSPTDKDDFFEIAGIWEGRDVEIETLRQQAWPRQHDDSP